MKILKLLSTLFILFVGINITHASTAVEDVFWDVSKSYPYYHQLQALYDRGMVTPDANGNLNPNETLNRDEFVSILMKTSCHDCLAPNISNQFLSDYQGASVFYDINKQNKNYYCIAWAIDKGYVKWYGKSATCSNGTQKQNQTPFCPANSITRQEALAIVMRASWIMTIEQEQLFLNNLQQQGKNIKLSEDVSSQLLDGSMNSFYPYLEKALEYEIVEYSPQWDKKSYFLLELSNNYIFPEQAVTKEDFLKIAYIALQSNSCQKQSTWNIAGTITQDDNNYIATLDTKTSGIYSYSWNFYHRDTQKNYFKSSQTVSRDFLTLGTRDIYLEIKDGTWNIGKYHSVVVITGDTYHYSFIQANPLNGVAPMSSLFQAQTPKNKKYTYVWDFGDKQKAYSKNTNHTFTTPWNYTVALTSSHSDGTKLLSQVRIGVEKWSCLLDQDGDTIGDCDDICPQIPWEKNNNGCPVFETTCQRDDECDEGFSCSQNGICKQRTIPTSCDYTWGNIILWNTTCNSCPCANSLDFNASLRKCDIIFPAIISPNKKEVYSKGGNYQIR